MTIPAPWPTLKTPELEALKPHHFVDERPIPSSTIQIRTYRLVSLNEAELKADYERI